MDSNPRSPAVAVAPDRDRRRVPALPRMPGTCTRRCASILGVQCSCFLVESRDLACVSEPPTRWKAGPVFILCRHLDSPNRAGRLLTRATRSRERIVGIPIPKGRHRLAQFLRPWTFRAYSWRPRRRRLLGAYADSIPGHPAGARRARSVRHRSNRHRQDRRLRTTNPAASRRRSTTRGAASLPRPRAKSDAGAGEPDRE
jgi:hypothetical protein